MMKFSMQRLIACIGVIGFSFFALKSDISAFDGPTHRYITKISLKILSDMGSEYSEFYSEDVKTRVLKYCVMPDKDENEGLFKCHFFNPATERNFMGERESALVKFKSHYKDAIRNYKTSNMQRCWEEIGRSVHFLEDLNTAVHTGYDLPTDACFKLPMHVEFEKRCLIIQEACVADISHINFEYFLINSNDSIGKASARVATDNFFSLENGLVPQDTIAEYSVLNAERAAVGVLYKFYMETCGNEKYGYNSRVHQNILNPSVENVENAYMINK